MDEARSLQYSINVKADTDSAESSLRNLTSSLGGIQSAADGIRVNADTAQAQRNIRDLTSNVGGLNTQADSVGDAFRKSFLSGIDSGNSFSASLKSGVGGAFTYAGSKATEFKDHVVSGAKSIKDGFAHPIDTIKNGLGNALKSAKDKFIDMARGADDAADSEKDVGDQAEDAKKSVRDLGDEADKSGGKFEKLGSALKATVAAIGAATIAVGAFAASSVDTGMQFDASMSQVAATMGYSVEELNTAGSEANETYNKLRDFALEMGSATAFSAQQSAEALNYMALAGYDAETSMKMLPNVLNLAAAGGIELAAASDMVTDAQSALGLTLEQTSVMVDQMAMASSKSNTSVQQLGDAILTVGGTAKNLAGGTTELSTALGILADNGVKGSEGGTALRNIILSLSAPTNTAAKELKRLGIEAFDSEGNLRPLNETMGDLNAALGKMTQEEQSKALNTIFNRNDLKSVNALLANSGERWDELTGYIGNAAGAAQNMADVQLDNLAGDITLFKSALEGAKIAISDELTPSLREFTQFGTDSIATLTTAFKEGGLTGAMGALGTILSDGLSMVIGKVPSFIDAGMQLLGALGQGLLDNMPLIVSAAVEILLMLSNGILDSLPVLAGAAMQVIAELGKGLGRALPDLIPKIVETVVLIARTLIENLPLVLDAGMQIIGGLAEGILAAIPILVEQLPELITQFVAFISDSLPTILEQGAEILSSLGNGILEAIPDLVAKLPSVIDGILGFLTENLPSILEQGVQMTVNLGMGIINAIPQLVAQLPQIITSIVNFVTTNLPLIVEQGINLIVQLAVGIVQAIPQLVAQLPQIITAIVGGLAQLPGMMLDIGVNVVKGIWNGISSMASWIGDQIKGFASGIVDGIKGFLGIKSPSTVFKDEVGKNMALGLGEGFTNEMGAVTKDIEKSIPTDFPDVNGPEVKFEPVNAPDVNAPEVNFAPVEMPDVNANLSDVTYSVSPIIEDIKTPPVSDISYQVNPVIGDFNPPGQPESTGDGSEDDKPQAVVGSAPPPPPPEPDGDGGGSNSSTFAPVIQITVEGNADDKRVENLRDTLYDTVRGLFEEFRQEELQHMALKNQYAF